MFRIGVRIWEKSCNFVSDMEYMVVSSQIEYNDNKQEQCLS